MTSNAATGTIAVTRPQVPPDSQPENPKDLQYWTTAYTDISKGNEHARDLLVAWTNFCHCIDDAVDRDKETTTETVVKAFLHWTMVVASNPFFATHRPELIPLIITSANAFIDSVRWETSEDKKQALYADAYRSYWDEFVFYVAFLVGGYEHMRLMSAKYRDAAYSVQHEEKSE